MKNVKKFIALVVALLLMSVSLCGCSELDDMREAQAFWTTEDSIDSITYQGVEYKKMDVTNPPDPLYNRDDLKFIYVTESDVPVLLSQHLSEYDTFHISEDHSFIYGSMYNYKIYAPEAVLYCKADMYNDMMSKFNEGIEYTKYGMGYYVFDENTGDTTWDYYYFTQEQIDAVNKVLKEVEATQDDSIDVEQSYVCQVDKISEDDYFGRYAFDIYTDFEGSYWIVQYSDALELCTCYEVPKELNDFFAELEKMAFQYENSFDEF